MPSVEIAAADLAHCQALLSRGSKTFALATRLFPREARPAVLALYAFCRVSDDSIDDPGADPSRALDRLRGRLDRIYAAAPDEDPVDRALAAVVETYRLPRAWLDALLEGYLWDAQGRRYHSIEDVLGYGARVAGSVGACMALFMGVTDRDTLARACDLGVAMQLTNIARDVAEDRRRGRSYLPSAWSALDDGSESWLESPIARESAERLLVRADELYARADLGIARLPARFRRSIRAARLLYAEIGHELRRRQWDLRRRAVVPTPRKLWLLFRSLWSRAAESAGPQQPASTATTRFLLDAWSEAHPAESRRDGPPRNLPISPVPAFRPE